MFTTNYNNDPTHQQVSGATMAAPPGNVKPWNAIKAFEELGRGNSMYGMFIRFGQLRSGLDPGSSLKVRKVFQTRLDEKKSKLAGGYMNSFPFCVRRTADGDLQDLGGDECFDVFDGNHRYHAIKKLIEEASQIYSDDSRIPCIVYKKALPNHLAMTHAAIVNDMQMAAVAGSPLDIMRFLNNMKGQCLANMPQGARPTDSQVCELVTANIAEFFQSQGAQKPTSWAQPRFVFTALSFLKHLGVAGLMEAERLQDFNPEAAYNLLGTIIDYVPAASACTLVLNPHSHIITTCVTTTCAGNLVYIFAYLMCAEQGLRLLG